jgi:ElaB/YqjD/DUF883 family membrane-anchored ribosome-binding protein
MMNTTFTYAGNGSDGSTSERIASSVHRTVDRIANKAGGVENDLRERIVSLREQARDQEQRARAAISAQVDNALGYARQQPIVAAGIAVAVGALVYALLRRR